MAKVCGGKTMASAWWKVLVGYGNGVVNGGVYQWRQQLRVKKYMHKTLK